MLTAKFAAQKICSHRRANKNIFVSLPLKSEQIAANSLLQKWRIRRLWLNLSLSGNIRAWENHCPASYDNKDLMRICKRVSMRVNRRKMGS